jgi:hypothetical protein
MPRHPTGRPRGRPVGTGKLGKQTRLTVRIPTDLYTRLEAFAAGRSFTCGTPQLAASVRQALEHFLSCPYKRQRNKEDVPETSPTRQLVPQTAPAKPGELLLTSVHEQRQEDLMPDVLPLPRAVEDVLPDGYYLSRGPCKRGHTWQQTERALMNKRRHCVTCERLRKRARL